MALDRGLGVADMRLGHGSRVLFCFPTLHTVWRLYRDTMAPSHRQHVVILVHVYILIAVGTVEKQATVATTRLVDSAANHGGIGRRV